MVSVIDHVKTVSFVKLTNYLKTMNEDNKKELSGESSTEIVEQPPMSVNLTPESLIAQAIDKGVPVETMEKLLSMRRELKAEWAKEEFTKAMAKFQAECPTIVKIKEVHTKAGALAYKYAPIESIVEQVKGVLQENGFSYSTNMDLLDNGVKVSVKVTHISGHSEITEMHVPLGERTQIMNQSQVVAAAQTFAKRYAFCNAFGILTGDEDDDAVSVKQETNDKSIKPTEKQIELIGSLCKQKGFTKEDIIDLGFTKLTGGKNGTASELIDYLLKATSKLDTQGRPIPKKEDYVMDEETAKIASQIDF